MDDTPINLDEEKLIRRMRNLKGNLGKTDDEIRQMLLNRKPKIVVKTDGAPKVEEYDIRFNEKMKILQQEYAVDTNNSNDAEALKSLVRFQIQLENVNKSIKDIQSKDAMGAQDYASLKSLGDFQKTVATSISEIQDKLGISRKIRKEKANDDIPQWMDNLLERAETFFDTKTVQIECPKCQIELARYWLNFPLEPNSVGFELTCWKCKETVMHLG